LKKEVLLLLILLPLSARMFLSISANLIWRGPEPSEPQVQESRPAETPDPPSFDPLDVLFPTLPPEAQAPEQTQPAQESEVRYTEDQLLSLSHDPITYGPGLAKDGEPAPYAPGAQEKYGRYGARFIESAENTIYLTFDCGYEYYVEGNSVTGMILDVLKEKDVKALFFVTGAYVEKNPELVRRILAEGHALGNHSADHKAMPTLGIRDMQEQILSLHRTVEEQFGYTMKFFRPPEGIFSLRSLAVTHNAGYETVHWSFAYADWDTANQPEPAAALEKILSCHHDGAIYLLHALSTTNAQVLGQVIDGLRGMGYRLELMR
jgi:peptidoglycan-N-acetylmuramic acid deacetylase